MSAELVAAGVCCPDSDMLACIASICVRSELLLLPHPSPVRVCAAPVLRVCVCMSSAGVLFYFFKPAGAGSCSLNVFLITASLLLCVGFSMLSLMPFARNGSLFPSSTTALYIMYLCYSALQSEPRDFECNGLGHRLNAASGSTLVIGMLVTLLSVVYSALRAGEAHEAGREGGRERRARVGEF